MLIRRPALLAFLAVLVLVAMAGTVGALPAAATTSDPPLSVPQATLDAALTCASPTFDHPEHEPVLLVHGTFTNADENWGWNYRVQLPADGYDVCWVNLPDRSLNDIQVASEYVVEAVRLMFGRDGQRPIAIVGHSQGALEPRWAVKWWPGIQPMVADLVTLAGPNHGTAVADPANPSCPACWQMKTTSNFISALNKGGETPGAVSYTAMYSLTDELVEPAAPTPVGRIEGGTNILVQQPDVCPGRPVDHVAFAYDKVVYDLVRDAIDHPGGAVPARAYASSSQPVFCAQTSIGDPAAATRIGLAELMNPQKVPSSSMVAAEPPLACYAGGPCPPAAAAAGPARAATPGSGAAGTAGAGGTAGSNGSGGTGVDTARSAALPATGATTSPGAAAGLLLVALAGLFVARAAAKRNRQPAASSVGSPAAARHALESARVPRSHPSS